MDQESRGDLPSIMNAGMVVVILAVANANPDCQQTRRDILTHTLKVTICKRMMAVANTISRVDHALNWCRLSTLSAIKCDVPTSAATSTWTVYPDICIVRNEDGTDSRLLPELTALLTIGVYIRSWKLHS